MEKKRKKGEERETQMAGIAAATAAARAPGWCRDGEKSPGRFTKNLEFDSSSATKKFWKLFLACDFI
jgi:hypothetical protein